MTHPGKQEPGLGPKERKDPAENKAANWPDVPDDRGMEDTGNAGNKRVDQMRHADNSDTLSNSTSDTDEGEAGYTDALVDQELDRGDGRDELL